MQIIIEVSEKNEGTPAPWWMIVDPKQNFKTNEDGVYAVASMITGPFFSREEAEGVLKATHYNYSKWASVFCASGCYTRQYANVFCASGCYTRQYAKKLKDADWNRG
jgi:hypothetical protein